VRTGALAIISRVTVTVSRATGLDCAKAAASTATTAPGIDWLVYVTLLVSRLSYSVVMFDRLYTTVLLVLTLVKYSRLTLYEGR
jgi:hypothetical protein